MQLEKDGDLLPLTRKEVQKFQGKRIEQLQTIIPVVILKVKQQAASSRFPPGANVL